jgi:hypothetical protein
MRRLPVRAKTGQGETAREHSFTAERRRSI